MLPHAPFPPDCAERFEPQGLIGSGGFATVWRAVQRDLSRTVAIKLLSPNAPPDSRAVERFEREARITATLSHPGIVVVLDHSSKGGVPWIAYEYVPGQTLAQRIATGPLGWEEAVAIGIEVAAALEEAHGRGILHRDIKPDNLLMSGDGRVKVADFGIACWREQEARLTAAGVIIGTPSYLSPTVIRGDPPAPELDLYALAVSLYELVVGRVPFVDESPVVVLGHHVKAAVPRPRALRPGVPVAVEQFLMRALAKEPRDRFEDAATFRQALEQLQRPAQSGSPTQRVRPLARRSRAPMAVGAAALVAAGVFLSQPRRFDIISPAEIENVYQLALNRQSGECLRRCDALLAKDPKNARVHLWQGVAHASTGSARSALASLTRARDEAPSDAQIFYHLGYVLGATGSRSTDAGLASSAQPAWMEGRRMEALRALGQATVADRTNPLYHYRLAELLRINGDPTSASNAYERALAAAPWYILPSIGLAKLHAAEGKWSATLSDTQAALTKVRGARLDPVPEKELGELHVDALLHLGRTRAAVRFLEQGSHLEGMGHTYKRRLDRMLFAKWYLVEHELSHLEGDRATGLATERRLNIQVRPNLGSEVLNWRKWIRYGQYLENGVATGRAVQVGIKLSNWFDSDALTPDTEAFFLMGVSDLAWLSGAEQAQLMRVAVDFTLRDVSRTRAPLFLGGQLAGEGLTAEARFLFDQVLKAAEPDAFDLWAQPKWDVWPRRGLWASLALALHRHKGYHLAKEWKKWVQAEPREFLVKWEGLLDALSQRDPDILESTLELMIAEPRSAVMARAVLGRFLRDVRGSPEKAKAIWDGGLSIASDTPILKMELMTDGLARGKLEQVVRYGTTGLHAHFLNWAKEVVTGSGPPPPIPPGRSTQDQRYHALLVRGWLDNGQLDQAVAALDPRKNGRLEALPPGVILDLVAAGCRRSDILHLVEGLEPAEIIADAAQSLVVEAEAGRMTKYLAKLDRSAPELTIYRALWLSRMGRLQESLDALDSYMMLYPEGGVYPEELAEVLARPHWEKAQGHSVPAAVLARAGDIRGLDPDAGAGSYLMALRSGKGAHRIASRERERRPASVFWSLACAQDAAGASPEWLTLRRAARWHGQLWLGRCLDEMKTRGIGSANGR